jgi:hypothetical protein
MEYAACPTFKGQSAEARRFSDQSHVLSTAWTLPYGRRIVGAFGIHDQSSLQSDCKRGFQWRTIVQERL